MFTIGSKRWTAPNFPHSPPVCCWNTTFDTQPKSFFRTTNKNLIICLNSDVLGKNTNLKTPIVCNGGLGWYIHSNITDNILGHRRLKKLFQDLKAMKQGVRLMEVVCTAIATVRGKRTIRLEKKETLGKYQVFLSRPYLQLRTQSISGSLGLSHWNT